MGEQILLKEETMEDLSLRTDITLTKELMTLVDKSQVDFSRIDRIFDVHYGRTVTRWTLLLPGTGCSWVRKSHGGCTFCGYHLAIDKATAGKLFSREELLGFCQIGRSVFGGQLPENLTIYMGGNFTNDQEIPPDAQVAICQMVQDDSTITSLLIETRVEHIREDRIRELSNALGQGKTLRIGIGLESQDDKIRQQVINKGLTKRAYERAIDILHQHSVEVLTYVFIKPMTLTEQEAIEEAVATVQYAHEAGSDQIALEAALIQKDTPMGNAYERGEFNPPWMWSILEVLKRTHPLGNVQIGKFKDEPPPLAGPKNCDQCTLRFHQLFDQYRISHDLAVFEGIHCSCQEKWQKYLVSESADD